MKQKRNIPAGIKMGDCVHIRLTEQTDEAFERKARELSIAKASYFRIWAENMYKNYGLVGITDDN